MAAIERASVCTFDCPDTCSLSVTVEAGQITKVRGSDAAPFTAGVICNKVAQDMAAFVHGPQRLLHPLRRTGPKGSGQFAPISWDAALDEIHARVSAVIERWGPQAVMPLNYAGPHGFLAGDSMSLRFFHKLGATPALPPIAVRRRAQRGMGRDLWCRARLSARVRRACQAQRRLGQQRDRHQRARCPCRPAGQAPGRQAGGGGSAAHEDRRAGRSASGIVARHRHAACLVGGGGTRTVGRARYGLYRRACAGRRGVHGAGAGVAG